MKIVMISGNPYGPNYGGVLIHVNYLLKFLSKLTNLQIYHISFGEKNAIENKDNITQIKIKRMKLAKQLFAIELIYDSFRIKRKIKEINPDIVHIQSTIPLFSLIALLINKSYNQIMTLHGYIREEYKTHSGFKKIINLLFGIPLEKMVLEKIPNIICLTPQMKKLIKKFTKSNCQVIPNGIDLEHIKKIEPKKDIGINTIFYLGMLTKGKGVSDLITAVETIKKDFPSITLLIGGNGPYESQLKEMVRKKNVQDSVKFLGFLNETKKFSYMKSIDIFILPSYWESFPIVLLEALASGKPIISTDVGGTSFAVKEKVNGYLYSPGDIYQLTQRIKELLTDEKLRKKMSDENLKKSIQFDWKKIALDTKKVYEETINS